MLTIIIVVIIIAMMPLFCYIDIHYIFILKKVSYENNPNWRIFQSHCSLDFVFSHHPLLINRRSSFFLTILIIHLLPALLLIIFFFILSYISHIFLYYKFYFIFAGRKNRTAMNSEGGMQ